MVRDIRIKEIIFPQFAVNAATKELFSDNPINGEIRDVIFTNLNTAGSCYISESGIGVPILSQNIASGPSIAQSHPRPYSSTVVGGVTGSPDQTYSVANGNVRLVASGLASGTGRVFGPVYVRYR